MAEAPNHSNNTVTMLITMSFEILFHLLYVSNLKLYDQTTRGGVP